MSKLLQVGTCNPEELVQWYEESRPWLIEFLNNLKDSGLIYRYVWCTVKHRYQVYGNRYPYGDYVYITPELVVRHPKEYVYAVLKPVIDNNDKKEKGNM